MIEINLLPKHYRQRTLNLSFGKSGLYIVAGAAAVVVVLLGITFYQMSQLAELDENIQRARQRAQMLKDDIRLVDGLLDVKQKITDRVAAVERLDAHRSSWVRILEDIARTVPQFVWLGHMSEKAGATAANKSGDNQANKSGQNANAQASQPPKAEDNVRSVEFEGYAFSLNALAKLMINMMNSDYFDEVELVSSDEVAFDDSKAYNFVVTCNLHYLSDEDLRKLVAQAEGTSATDAKPNTTSHRSLN